MEGVLQELSMFIGPIAISAGVAMFFIFILGILTLKKWIINVVVIFVVTLVFLGAIVFVNSIEPEEITTDIFSPTNFIIWLFQQLGKFLLPGMNSIEESIENAFKNH